MSSDNDLDSFAEANSGYEADGSMGDEEQTGISSSSKKKKRFDIGTILHSVFLDSKALKTFLTNLLLAYNIRAGVALLLRMLSLVAKKPKDMLDLNTLLGETNLSFRVEAVRIGLFVGGFSGVYRAVCHALAEYVSNGSERWHSAVSGFIAGMSLGFMDKSWHRTLALYMATRMVQCFYNFAKVKGHFNFPTLQKHGDALLFILSSSQIMYAYVMRPQTLPASYYKFIVRQGPIDETILQAVRDNVREKAINLPAVMDYVKKSGGDDAVKSVQKYLTNETPKLIPIRALHPFTKHSILSSVYAFTGTSKRIFPVYLSLALVPAVVLRFKYFAKEPVSVLLKSILSAARSTSFLAGFCGSYMGVIAIQRFILENYMKKSGDHKLIYYFAGIVSSFSILIERKSRRSELALYAFPRAMDSLYHILYDHQLAFRVPQGEMLLFCASMGCVMWFYENETACLSPLVAKLLDRFLPKRGTKKIKVKEHITKKTSVEGGSRRRVKFDGSSSGDSDDDKNLHGTRELLPHSKSTVSLSGGFTMVP